MPLKPHLSVVVPAFNEAARIGSSLHELRKSLQFDDAEILVVDDGSTDETGAIATQVLSGFGRWDVIRLDRNRGKGAAIREGMRRAQGEVLVFMDADLATDIDDLPKLVGALDAADIAIGSRTIPGSRTQGGTPSRAVMAQMFNAMARPIIGVDIRDTQCGFKALHADAARKILPRARSNRFAFDVELLTIAQRLGMKLVEVPVNWTAVDGSTVHLLRDPVQMTVDLLRIAIRCRPSRFA